MLFLLGLGHGGFRFVKPAASELGCLDVAALAHPPKRGYVEFRVKLPQDFQSVFFVRPALHPFREGGFLLFKCCAHLQSQCTVVLRSARKKMKIFSGVEFRQVPAVKINALQSATNAI